MKKRGRVSVGILWVLVWATFAAAQEPIRIGLPLALTGPLALNGEDNRKGTLLYFEEVGFQLSGRKVEVKVEDTEAKPDVALTKVRKLVERDRVHALVGIVSSAEAYALRDYIHAQGVPTVITTAGAKDVTLARKSPVIFRVANDTTQEALALGHYAFTRLAYRRTLVIASDFAGGRELAQSFVQTFSRAGGQALQQVFAPLGTIDFAPYIAQLKLDQADVLFVWFAGGEPIRMITQLKEYGVKTPILSQGALAANYALPSMGDAALGIVTAKHYSDVLDTPENRRFVAAFVKKYNDRPDAWSEQGYVGAKTVGEAVKAVGGRIEDRPQFLEALRKTRFEGPAGLVRFDQNQQRVFDVYIRRVEKVEGRYVNQIIDKIPNVGQDWTP